MLVRTAYFMQNVLHTRSMSAITLARGYNPFIRGIPACLVTTEIGDAHVHNSVATAVQRLMNRKRGDRGVTKDLVTKGTQVWVILKIIKADRDCSLDTGSGGRGWGAHSQMSKVST